MGKKSARSGKYIAWGIGFLSILVLIILCSFVWKFVVFLGQSAFDSAHQFTIGITGKNPEIITFNPDESSVTVVSISQKNVTDEAKTLSIPLDGTIVGDSSQSVKSLLLNALIHHSASFSPIDICKLWLFVNGLPSDALIQTSLPSDTTAAAAIVPKIFQDKSLYSEGKSITIVNATGVSGLGSQLAKLLTNIGANVIMVSTADTQVQKSSIQYSGSPSYTTDRLGRLLHLQPILLPNSSKISDITITIGKDTLEHGIF